jgi:hypothetical protein
MPDDELFSVGDQEEADEDLIYDTRVSNSLFTQLVHSEFCSCFFANTGLLVSIVYFEI